MTDDEELAAIQARDAAMPDLDGAPQFYHDRRTLLRLLNEARAENERLRGVGNE